MLNFFKESVKVGGEGGYGKKGLLFQLYNIIGDDGSNDPSFSIKSRSGSASCESILFV